METPQIKPVRLLWISGLMVLAIIYRVWSSYHMQLANTSPLMAMAFGGGLLLGRKFWWVPSLLLVSSDVALAMIKGIDLGGYTLLNGVCYTFAALGGAFFGKQQRNSRPKQWPVLWLGTLGCSVLFYLIGNTFSWAGSIAYPQTFAGWWQSQTVGVPAWAPSIYFLRNALIGDSIWCVVAAPLFFWNALRYRNSEVTAAV